MPQHGYIEPVVLVADLAVFPAALNQAHCQPVGRLAKVHEHCSSGTMRARYPQAGPLRVGSLPFPARRGLSWLLPPALRGRCFIIISSARPAAVGLRSFERQMVSADKVVTLKRYGRNHRGGSFRCSLKITGNKDTT
jgi:hypothetical protein